jgi:tripartite ATP-independent transporter DctP family solute receptor
MHMHVARRGFLAITATALAAGLVTGAALAAESEKLIVGIMTSKDYPFTKGAMHFAERLKEESGGALTAEVFPDGVLGNEAEMFEGMKRGTIDAIVTSPGNLSSFVPQYQILDVPFLFRDAAHRAAVADGPVGEEFGRLLEKDADIVVLGNFGGPIRNIISREKKVTSLDDIQGIKMRVWQAPVIIDTWKSLGTNATVVAYREVYTALQTGVVDAAENEPPTFVTQKWYEPSKYITLSRHSYTIRPFIMSGEKFRSLSPEQQALVKRLGREAADYEVKLEIDFGDKALKEIEAKFGVQLVELSDRSDWIERTEPVRRRVAEKLGVADLLQRIYAAGR